MPIEAGDSWLYYLFAICACEKWQIAEVERIYTL